MAGQFFASEVLGTSVDTTTGEVEGLKFKQLSESGASLTSNSSVNTVYPTGMVVGKPYKLYIEIYAEGGSNAGFEIRPQGAPFGEIPHRGGFYLNEATAVWYFVTQPFVATTEDITLRFTRNSNRNVTVRVTIRVEETYPYTEVTTFT